MTTPESRTVEEVPDLWSWDTEDDDEWLSEFSGEDVRALVRERNRLLGESRSEGQRETGSGEERLATAIWDALSDRGELRIHADSPKEVGDITRAIVAAAKEHGLVIGEGELDVERLERALVAEIHVDPDHGFPADFTGRMLADLVAREYERLRR